MRFGLNFLRLVGFGVFALFLSCSIGADSSEMKKLIKKIEEKKSYDVIKECIEDEELAAELNKKFEGDTLADIAKKADNREALRLLAEYNIFSKGREWRDRLGRWSSFF